MRSTKNVCCLRGQRKSKEQATQQTVFRSNLVVQSLYMISMYQGVVWVPLHV